MTVISTSVPATLDADVGAAPSPPVLRWPATATALMLVAVAGISGIRGADYPAHHLRAELVRRGGFSIWNFAWYTGHATLPYGLLSSLLGALIGPFAVVAIATVLATHLFAGLIGGSFQPRAALIAAHTFAVTATINVVVGRVAFGLGLAAALIALTCWRKGRHGWAVIAAATTPLASPVAAVFLVVAACAGAVGRGRRQSRVGAAIAVAAAVPIGLTSLLFKGAGWFPFRAGHLLVSVAVLAGVACTVRVSAVRLGAIAAILGSVVLFLVPNPLGGNVVRLAQVVAVPMIVAATCATPNGARRARTAMQLMSMVAFGWSLSPGAVEVAATVGDASSSIAYHRPLIDAVRRLNGDGRPLGRLEVPFTENHWEAYFVASEVPYVRGWERQLDLARNPELYSSDLTTDEYHAWLRDNAVRWVAVPDATIDRGGATEVRLVDAVLRSTDPWLRPVYSDTHWQVYELVDAVPIVDLPAVVTSFEPAEVWLHTNRPATVALRVAYSPWLTISPDGRLAPTPSGMVEVTLPRPGDYCITASLSRLTSS